MKTILSGKVERNFLLKLSLLLFTLPLNAFNGHETIADLGDISHPNGGRTIPIDIKNSVSLTKPAEPVTPTNTPQDEPVLSIDIKHPDAIDNLTKTKMTIFIALYERLELQRLHFKMAQTQLNNSLSDIYFTLNPSLEQLKAYYPELADKLDELDSRIKEETSCQKN